MKNREKTTNNPSSKPTISNSLDDNSVPHGRVYPWYVLFVMFLVFTCNYADRNVLVALIEPIKGDLGISDTQIGLLGGFSFAVFYGIMGIPLARAADNYSRKNIIAVGLVLWSVMTAASGLAKNFTHLLLARIGVGIGEAACAPATHSLLADYFGPDRRATALAIYSIGTPAGIMLGLVLGGWIEHLFNWRTAFVVIGVPGVLLALLVRLTVRDPKRGHFETASGSQQDELPPIREVLSYLWRTKSYVYLQIASILQGLVVYSIAFWMVTFLVRVHGVDNHEATTWLGSIGFIAGISGALCGGLLTDKLQARDKRWYFWIPGISVLLSIPFTLTFLMAGRVEYALVAFFFHMFNASSYSGPISAATQSIVKPRMRATAVAIHLFVVSIVGLGLGPLIIGILNDALAPVYGADYSVRYSLISMCSFMVVAGLFYFIAARTIREDFQAARSSNGAE